jgi:hypothetical protein
VGQIYEETVTGKIFEEYFKNKMLKNGLPRKLWNVLLGKMERRWEKFMGKR